MPPPPAVRGVGCRGGTRARAPRRGVLLLLLRVPVMGARGGGAWRGGGVFGARRELALSRVVVGVWAAETERLQLLVLQLCGLVLVPRRPAAKQRNQHGRGSGTHGSSKALTFQETLIDHVLELLAKKISCDNIKSYILPLTSLMS